MYYLIYKAELQSFCIADTIVHQCEKYGMSPKIQLLKSSYEAMSLPQPDKDAPTIAFLLGRIKGYYTADYNCVYALTKAGLNIRFVTYAQPKQQVGSCQGLLLTGGDFAMPEKYYDDIREDMPEYPSVRSKAAVLCVHKAMRHHIPVLGIGAGAQMVAGELGLKICRDVTKLSKGQICHKSDELNAHTVDIVPDTLFSKLMQGQPQLSVNSQHSGAVIMPPKKVAEKIGLDFYAFAPDGVPEAWGNEEKKILCTQWHPEDYAVQGDENMQRIFCWLADAACAQ